MGKRIIAVNAGPRKGWNTDLMNSYQQTLSLIRGPAEEA